MKHYHITERPVLLIILKLSKLAKINFITNFLLFLIEHFSNKRIDSKKKLTEISPDPQKVVYAKI